MKNGGRVALFVTVVFIFSGVCFGQSEKAAGEGILDIAGAKLHLGMTKAEVAAKLSDAGVTKSSEDNWIVGGNQVLQFTNDKLNFACRSWKSDDNDVIMSFYGVVVALNREGYHICVVSADIGYDPNRLPLHRVWIDCGEKTISILRYPNLGGGTRNEIIEVLGARRKE